MILFLVEDRYVKCEEVCFLLLGIYLMGFSNIFVVFGKDVLVEKYLVIYVFLKFFL